ncbi:hypothetical protein CPB83DRAFT_844989 [Crepidotus variabilis]|uniref:SnoaL-like domain-containing protein n=1 Tax=Crepidotus variabilis TaxID=179855 RepID=A0A9P6JV09_9AGAR|nr:hypothetical protein CPB83DRAFT_844989 [Crepidotus variabilis]
MFTKAEATRSLIQEFNDLFSTHKFQEAARFAAPGATWWMSGLKENNPMAGLHTFEEHFKHVESIPKTVIDWDTVEVDIVELVVDADGEKAVVEVAVKIREDDGEYRYKNNAVLIIEVKEGKIQVVKEYVDFAPFTKYIKEKEEKRGKA